MTRRERLERKLEKRAEWAEGRRAKADNLRAATPDRLRRDWALTTQPGHIPERARMNRRDDKASEHDQMAAHHEAKAEGLARQLDRTIFSDDPDAVEQLRAKAAALRAKRDEGKRLNAWWRKHGTMAGCPGVTPEQAVQLDADIPTRYSWERQPVAKWKLTNLGAEIRRAEQRIAQIEQRAQRTAKAEADGGVFIEGAGEYVRVTFAEKPERHVLDALKAAGFTWGGGSWSGRRNALPPVMPWPDPVVTPWPDPVAY